MKAAVIGGGIAGLVAANELALGGARVTLHERSSTLGGRAISDGVEGTWLNRGPHALYRAGLALPILRRLGVEPFGNPPNLIRFDIALDDALMQAPTTPWAAASADLMSWSEKLQLARFLAAVLRLDPTEWEDRPFGQLADRYATTSVTRRILRMMCAISTFGWTPRISAATAMRQIRASISNVLYLKGGWQSLVTPLAELAVSRGVQIELSSRVDDVDEIDADVVVLAVGPDSVEQMTGADFGPRRPTRMAALDLVMRNPPRPMRNTFDVDRGVFLSFHPEGAVHCARYLDPFSEPDGSAARAAIEEVLDLAQPGWRDRTEHVRYLPKIRVNEWFPDAETGGQAGRPSVALDERVFLAGDWVGPHGHLVDAACHTAVEAAQAALARFARAAT